MADMPEPNHTVSKALEQLVEKQVRRCQALSRSARPPANAKPADIKAWEDARKAAVQHLQALIRARQMAGAAEGRLGGGDGLDLVRLLQEAEADVANAGSGSEAQGQGA